MSKSILSEGLINPIIVEGPDVKGVYYIIDGARRFKALKKMDKLFPYVDCNVIREITSKQKRNEKRLQLTLTEKNATMLEKQEMYNDFDELGKGTLPNDAKRKFERGTHIPKEIREKTAEAMASKEAMEVIHSLKINEDFRASLYERLWNREIKSIHAKAFKQVMKFPLFTESSEEIKQEVINRVIKDAEFTYEKAGLIIEKTVMIHDPKMWRNDDWIIYNCREIQKQINQVNPLSIDLMKDESKKEVKKTIEFMSKKFSIDLDLQLKQYPLPHKTKEMMISPYEPKRPIIKINGKIIEYLFVY